MGIEKFWIIEFETLCCMKKTEALILSARTLTNNVSDPINLKQKMATTTSAAAILNQIYLDL